MGTPKFAVPTLEKLINNQYSPCLVISQPDKPQGRKKMVKPTPVKEVADKNRITCFQPVDINSQDSIEYIKTFNPDIIITVAYGAFLGKKLRTMCPFGAINLHPSLLPKHRGADPIRSTLINGDTISGISVFFITAKMDSGNIITQREYLVNDMNFTELSDYLSVKGAEEIIKTISILENKNKEYKELKDIFSTQEEEAATYSNKLDKISNRADFQLEPMEFIRNVNAYSNEPGYYCFFRNKRIKILKAELFDAETNEVYPTIKSIEKNKGFVLCLKNGSVLIKEIKYEGKLQMNAYEFYKGARLEIGERFQSEEFNRN